MRLRIFAPDLAEEGDMKVELHLHTSRYSECATADPLALMAALTRAGYEAVFLTEHDRLWPAGEIRGLQERFPAIRIFPGLERTICSDPLQHLVILGTDDPAYLATADPVEILRKARAEGHLTVLAHPFRWDGAAEILAGEILPDAMEYQTYHQNGRTARPALAAATELSLPMVNAGDVHALSFVDRYWIQTTEPIEEARDVRRIVLAGRYANCTRRPWAISRHRWRIEPARGRRTPQPPHPWREDSKQTGSALDTR